MNETDSRTTMNGNQVVWESDEHISVFGVTAASTYTNCDYTLTGGNGTPDATFEGTLDGQSRVAAMYPYATTNRYDGTKIHLSLGDNCTYTEGSNNKAPMAAELSGTDQNENIVFLNAGALMALKVNNIPAGYKVATLEATGTNDPAIAGDAEITFANGLPTLKIASTATAKKMIYEFAALSEKSNKTFYFPLPVANYEMLKFSISDGTDTKILKEKALDAKRNVRYTTTITLDAVTGSIPAVATIATAANELKNNTSISIQDVPAGETNLSISLPTETDGKEISIAFDAINTNEKITINAADTQDQQVATSLHITVPSESDKANLEIDLPNTTVTITVSGETGTIPSVTASTSENTLIVEKGVTITNLNIAKGNVRLKEGAKIGTISRSAGNNEVVYIYNEGGTITDLNTGCVEINAVETALHDAFAAGQNYTLTQDITLQKPLVLGGSANMILDLGEYTITTANTIWNDVETHADDVWSVLAVTGSANLTINATTGGIKALANDAYAAHVDGDNAKLTINGGKYLGNFTTVYVCKGELEINGGSYDMTQLSNFDDRRYLINCLDANYKDNTAKVSINGGTFTGFNPQNNLSEGANTNYLKSGLVVETTEGVYEVLPTTNGEITLSKDLVLYSAIVVDKDMTFNLGQYTITTANTIWNDVEEHADDVWSVLAVTGGNVVVNATTGGIESLANDAYAAHVDGDNAKLTINGGNYLGNFTTVYVCKGELEINGGSFNMTQLSNFNDRRYLINCLDANYKDNTAKVSINGGTFTGFNPQNNLSEGANTNYLKSGLVVETAEDVFEVLKEENGIVSLTEDLTLYSGIVINKSMTLNLNEFTIVAGKDLWYDVEDHTQDVWSILAVTGGDVTINATTGGIIAKENDTYACHVDGEGATLTLNGGVYNGNVSAIYVCNGALYVKDGTFKMQQVSSKVETDKRRYLLNCKDENLEAEKAKIEVEGGTFYGFNPSDNQAENPKVNFCKNGYAGTQTGAENGVDIYSVSVITNN